MWLYVSFIIMIIIPDMIRKSAAPPRVGNYVRQVVPCEPKMTQSEVIAELDRACRFKAERDARSRI